ncbi:hypothetical protein L950_0211670 [Sphingobacterium sp. IITKGP-BTPF85]|nr:hypothetical protein L950_0211670 [Sphingobacterium sp. IITKGP-BTPF85]
MIFGCLNHDLLLYLQQNTISNYKINEYESSSFIYHNFHVEFVSFFGL